MTDRELMQMALDAMESFENGTNGLYTGEFAEERKALRDRLAQPEPEPVGFFSVNDYGNWQENESGYGTPFYEAPVHAIDISQERVDETAKCGHEWVGLTDDERKAFSYFVNWEMLEQIEAKLKEKNC